MVKKFIQPKKEEPEEVSVYSLRQKKTQASYSRVNFSFDNEESYLDRRRDAVENINIQFQNEYGKDLVSEKLISIQKVLLPEASMFEHEDGSLDTEHKVRSCLVYKVLVEILDEQAKKAGFNKTLDLEHGAAAVIFTIGRYSRPIVEPTAFDKQGKVTSAAIKSYKWTYWIENNEKNLQDIITKYGKPLQAPTVAISSISGERPVSNSFSLIEEDDFYSGRSVEDIIAGNKVQLPVSAYQVWETKKQQLMKGGTATKAQLDQLDSNDILEIIQVKDKRRKKQ